MKVYLFSILFLCSIMYGSAQTEDYNELWRQVDSLEEKGLPKSALKIVNEIMSLARSDDNEQQQIKALLFQSKYALDIEEDAQLKIINDFKETIHSASSPTRNVLQNYLANLYWQYFQQNRYKFFDRTRTATKVDTTDFRTWDLETLFSQIGNTFDASLHNQKILRDTNIDEFQTLMVEEKGSRLLRPSLYDLLAHNALSFYMTDESAITQPAYSFQIENTELLSIADDFKELNLQAKDSTSSKFKALKIYQELIEFHIDKDNKAALVDVDIDRLLFVLNNATFNEKDAIFLSTLQSSKGTLKDTAEAALYDFEIAALYARQGYTYNPDGDTEHRWKLKEALDLCNTIISSFPNSVAADKSQDLKSRILQPSLAITTEKFIPTDRVSKVLVRYKNIDALDYEIFKVSPDQVRIFNTLYRDDKQLNFLKGLKPLTIISSELIDEGDFQTHTLENVVPALENGHYILLAKVKKSQIMATTTIQATDFALVERDGNEDCAFQLIGRLTGEPIAGARIAFSYLTYSNKNYLNKSFTTDKNGQFTINKDGTNYRNIKILAQKDGHSGYFEDFYISSKYNSERYDENTQFNGFIFTDRAIYRPGQTVFFKAIAINTLNNKSKVLENQLLTAELVDVNYQVVHTKSLLTNEFGSISGEFTLPSNGLGGQYHIRIKGEKIALNASKFFLVEEYKRPRFKTEFLPISKTYAVNDRVTVKGRATAYSGSTLSDAKVVYRVYRKVQFPRWFYWSRPWQSGQQQEIISGETTTDSSGNYTIQFKALPDETVDKKNLPIFNYEVSAEVTDINGETQQTTTIVNVGYHDIKVDIVLPEIMEKAKDGQDIVIETRNLNDEFISAEGVLSIYKLAAPESVLRHRPWANPDYKSMDRGKFKELFPYEAYDNEDSPQNWERGSQVFSQAFDTKDSKTLRLSDLDQYKSGMYIVEVVIANNENNDDSLKTIKESKLFKIIDKSDNKVSDNQLFEVFLDKNDYKVGEKVELNVGTAAKDLVVTVSVEKDQKLISTQILTLDDERKRITIDVGETDLGGFAILYSYAYQNDYESGSLLVSVPYPDSELKIETSSFRDRLKPGQDETWEFLVKGPKGEKVSAEILAGMYDLSLDQFVNHSWAFNPLNQLSYNTRYTYRAYRSFNTENYRIFQENIKPFAYKAQQYEQLNWFGLNFHRLRSNGNVMIRGMAPSLAEVVVMDESAESAVMNQADATSLSKVGSVEDLEEESDATKNLDRDNLNGVLGRKNLNETAFFFPQLKTDEQGNIRFQFTSPEALTTWKVQLLAHTKSLQSTVQTLETVTQKELMVIPNAPRFLRQGDQIVFSSKISNLTDKPLSGNAKLVLTDALTGKEVDYILKKGQRKNFIQGQDPNIEKSFSIGAEGNTQVSWLLDVPDDVQAIQYKIVALAGEYSDGEQNVLPVLSNRELVTETLPMWVRSNETRKFTLDKLKVQNSNTLKHHKLTLEVTSNPAWYALQSLPYLIEYPFECNEQIFSRIYANALAGHIANSNSRVRAVFDQWASSDALISNLEKNEELKSIIISETPWLRAAQSESEQKKRIGMLFNINKMSYDLQASQRKLANNQTANGAWAWFNGGPPNRFITQHIIAGFGHLDRLEVATNDDRNAMVNRAFDYLDSEFIKEYKDLTKYSKDVDLKENHLSYSQIHYLYVRSFYPSAKKSDEVQTIMDYYYGQITKYWLSQNLYAKGMMALITKRHNDDATANAILRSLKENSITNEELGMYWKENTKSWLWYSAPIETQALMIEAFSEILNEKDSVDNLKIWLLKNKQTNSWGTTKATTDATYALLLQGSDWLSVRSSVDVDLGDHPVDPNQLEDVKVEAGTGYYKTSWDGPQITSEMAEVTMTKKSDGIAWGAVYWQYFEDLDNITSAETPLKLNKKIFKRTYTDTGEILTEITDSLSLNVGDLVRVRIELRVNRDMEYIHMKDMRASGLEPINIMSSYKWQDGLGYYESTKDASTNFFFDYLAKGIYVFEYDLRINNAGNMSNGITTIKSMYAPEFSSHSDGKRIDVGYK